MLYRQELFRFGEIVKSAQGGDLQIKTFGTELADGGFGLGFQGARPFGFQKGHEVGEFDLPPIL